MNQIVKEFHFGTEGKEKLFKGIDTLAGAVASTLGAGGETVIFEDNAGVPVITKDGVTVANLCIMEDPVENMGASMVKQAAQRTVQDAGDGTTTATVLTHSLLHALVDNKDINKREVAEAINTVVDKVTKYLDKISKVVDNSMIEEVATISTNNDIELGKLIADAYRAVDLTGIVMMETSKTGETALEVVEGVQYDKGFINNHFVNNQTNNSCEQENPLILLIDSQVDTVRQIQTVLEHVIKNKRSFLIIGDVDPKVAATLAMNKNKGNIDINIVPAPTHGVNRKEMFDDLALLTGATVISENLGDDLDLIDLDHLGTCTKATSTFADTVIQINNDAAGRVAEIVANLKEKLSSETNPNRVIKIEKRLAMLSAKVAIVQVGGNSDIELKEKRDRVEDAICATKAAIKEGVVAGGGVALAQAAAKIKTKTQAERIVMEALIAPYKVILQNAGLLVDIVDRKDWGIDARTGKAVNMFKAGIIDPVLVTKSALRNAASVASTILSTNCIMSNLRA
jgi:chaperonin GroEL